MVPQVQLYTAIVLSSQKPELEFCYLHTYTEIGCKFADISLVSNGHRYEYLREDLQYQINES